VSNYSELVGDYNNPDPAALAADVVEERRATFESRHCLPESGQTVAGPEPIAIPVKHMGMAMLQLFPNEIVMMFSENQEVRRVAHEPAPSRQR